MPCNRRCVLSSLSAFYIRLFEWGGFVFGAVGLGESALGWLSGSLGWAPPLGEVGAARDSEAPGPGFGAPSESDAWGVGALSGFASEFELTPGRPASAGGE